MDCPLACPGPEHLTAAGRVGQGSVEITSHRPEPNIEIAARLTKTRLRFSLVPRRCAGKYPPAAREISAPAISDLSWLNPTTMQSLCTLRNHCRQRPRNTRYQADATPYLGRTFTGRIAPACGWRTYSITSSASSTNESEIVSPIALVALRLTMNS